MLGQPIDLVTPDVIGFKLQGALREGCDCHRPDPDGHPDVTPERRGGEVRRVFWPRAFIDVFCPIGLRLPIWSPEYGRTIGFFPVDEETLRYLRLTGRPAEVVERVERYCKEQGLFRTDDLQDPEFTDILELDLRTVEPSLAGPKRPQDRVALSEMKRSFQLALRMPVNERGYELNPEQVAHKAAFEDQ